MAGLMLHNLCIKCDDPCEPRKLKVQQLSFNDTEIDRCRTNTEAERYRMKISNWLWSFNSSSTNCSFMFLKIHVALEVISLFVTQVGHDPKVTGVRAKFKKI